MILEHERIHGLGMHALLTVCSWIVSGMVSAWTRWTAELAVYTGGRAKVLENPRQNMHRGPTTKARNARMCDHHLADGLMGQVIAAAMALAQYRTILQRSEACKGGVPR